MSSAAYVQEYNPGYSLPSPKFTTGMPHDDSVVHDFFGRVTSSSPIPPCIPLSPENDECLPDRIRHIDPFGGHSAQLLAESNFVIWPDYTQVAAPATVLPFKQQIGLLQVIEGAGTILQPRELGREIANAIVDNIVSATVGGAAGAMSANKAQRSKINDPSDDDEARRPSVGVCMACFFLGATVIPGVVALLTLIFGG